MLGLDGLGFGVVRKPLGGRLCSGPPLLLRLAHLVENRGIFGVFENRKYLCRKE